jgi:hypothetical protein
VPGTSNRELAVGSTDSGTCRAETHTTKAANGRFTRNTSRQVHASTSQPPRKGPAAPAIPASPDHAPIARDRSAGANDAEMIARLPGVSSAPPMPCNSRAPISVSMFGASPHSAEASANQIVPITKMRRRPNRSDSEPPSRMKLARVSV